MYISDDEEDRKKHRRQTIKNKDIDRYVFREDPIISDKANKEHKKKKLVLEEEELWDEWGEIWFSNSSL